MTVITDILSCEEMLDGVDGVVFDLDDTLYSEKEYVRSGYCAVAAAFPQIEHMVEKLWGAFEQKLPAIDVVLAAEGLNTLEHKAAALAIYRTHQPKIVLYPGVRDLLQRLKKTKRLGMITDGRSEGQRAKLSALGIESLFDKVIITDELGGTEYRKPNEKAFRVMQQALGMPFERMVYIGDNTKKDFIAPEKLGMQTIWFANTEGLYNES